MIVYLAGENGKSRILQSAHKIGGGQIDDCLLGRRTTGELAQPLAQHSNRGGQVIPIPKLENQQILESYYYLRKNPYMPSLIPYMREFMLDSGCFTFMSDKTALKKENLEQYTHEYIEFVNQHNIKNFVEMDVDSLLGLKKAEELRKKIEAGTGRQPIPVWHISRGKQYFIDLVKDYPYVAFGGMITDGKSLKELEPSFPWFIDKAHEYNCKIHGLGYTRIQGLHQYHFDSVDSTAWLVGNRAGFAYLFDARKGDFIRVMAKQGQRLKSQDAALHNFLEWNKFQEYARKYL